MKEEKLAISQKKGKKSKKSKKKNKEKASRPEPATEQVLCHFASLELHQVLFYNKNCVIIIDQLGLH